MCWTLLQKFNLHGLQLIWSLANVVTVPQLSWHVAVFSIKKNGSSINMPIASPVNVAIYDHLEMYCWWEKGKKGTTETDPHLVRTLWKLHFKFWNSHLTHNKLLKSHLYSISHSQNFLKTSHPDTHVSNNHLLKLAY